MAQQETPEERAIAFGRVVAKAREDAWLSVREAADRAGISEGRWRQVELGYQQVRAGVRVSVRPRPQTVRVMAEAVGADPRKWLARAGHKVPKDLPSLDPHPVGLGLDAEADGLTQEQVDAVRAVIRGMKARDE